MKKQELKTKNKEELLKQLDQLKGELASLRAEKQSGGAASKVASIGTVRKNIARVHTFVRLGERKALKEAFKGKKYKPLDLRPKKTRAMRKALTKRQENKMTIRQQKRKMVTKPLVYALKA